MRPILLLLSLASPASAFPARIQTELFHVAGLDPDGQYGYQVGAAGDVDGDGFDDVLVGDLDHEQPVSGKGRVQVLSGATGLPLRTLDGGATSEQFGHSVAGIGDVDGDLHDDFVVSDPYDTSVGGVGGKVFAFSGQTGGLLWDITGGGGSGWTGVGWSVAGVGDVDGDSIPDVAIGAPFTDASSGRVIVVRGQDGAVIEQFEGSQSLSYFGWSVAGVGNMDHDGSGLAEIAIGNPKYDSPAADQGRVVVLSVLSGAVLHDIAGPEGGAELGTSVDGTGDIDQDGTPDFVVGAPLHDFGGVTNCGSARVVSGATGATIWEVGGAQHSDVLGYSVAGLGDVDGDGWRDFALGGHGYSTLQAPGSSPGGAMVHSGRTGLRYYELLGDASGDRFGWSISAVGDANGDGHADIAVGATQPFGGAGYAEVFALHHCQADVGFGGPGAASLSLCGTPLWSGGSASLRLTGAPLLSPCLVIASPQMLPIPFAAGTIVPDITAATVLVLVTNGNGTLSFSNLKGGNGPFSFWVQVLTFDPLLLGDWSFSNAVRGDWLP